MRECARKAKPVIIATQMLKTMISNPRPTRAENSDISNSVMYCVDAIMLSGETAVGKHPAAAVGFMVRTALETEDFQKQTQQILPWSGSSKEKPPIDLGITYSANQLVELLKAKALMVFTMTGGTARMVASSHPMVPIFTFTSNRSRVRRQALLRGTVPFLVSKNKNFTNDLGSVFRMLTKRRLVKKGDRVVITTGTPVGIPHWTNVIRVEEIP